jgi:hypothetical protein
MFQFAHRIWVRGRRILASFLPLANEFRSISINGRSKKLVKVPITTTPSALSIFYFCRNKHLTRHFLHHRYLIDIANENVSISIVRLLLDLIDFNLH